MGAQCMVGGTLFLMQYSSTCATGGQNLCSCNAKFAVEPTRHESACLDVAVTPAIVRSGTCELSYTDPLLRTAGVDSQILAVGKPGYPG